MPPGSPHAAEPANNPELRQIGEDRASGSGLAGFVIPSRTASMRSRSRRSATRCSSDRRFSRNNILASSAARAQTGRWRAVMQALGHRVGSQSATSGQARCTAIGNRGIGQGTPNDDSISGSTGISERPLPSRRTLLSRGCECLLRVDCGRRSLPPPLRGRALLLDRAFKFSLSRLKSGQFFPEISNLLADCSQFGPGFFAYQVF
jgi:hypothetical protein